MDRHVYTIIFPGYFHISTGTQVLFECVFPSLYLYDSCKLIPVESRIGMVCLCLSVWAIKYLPIYKLFDGKNSTL